MSLSTECAAALKSFRYPRAIVNMDLEVKPYKPDWLILPELIPVSVA